MRFTVRSLVFFGFSMGVLVSAVLAQDKQRLRYGTTNSIMNLPVWVAQDARLFAKHGLTNVEVIFIQSGTLITMGVVSGELNFSGAGAASVVAARIKGGDVALLACPVDADAVYLIARPGVKSAAELRAKPPRLRDWDRPRISICARRCATPGWILKKTSRSCSSDWISPGHSKAGRLTLRLCRSTSPFPIYRKAGRFCWISQRRISSIRPPAWSAAEPLSRKARESSIASSKPTLSPFTS